MIDPEQLQAEETKQILAMVRSKTYTFSVADRIEEIIKPLSDLESMKVVCQVVKEIDLGLLKQLACDMRISSVDGMEPIGIAVNGLADAGMPKVIFELLKSLNKFDAFAALCLLEQHENGQPLVDEIALQAEEEHKQKMAELLRR